MKLLDTVVLIEEIEDEKLQKGQVGAIVEELAPDVFEVEFVNLEGKTIAMCAIEAEKLLPLQYELLAA